MTGVMVVTGAARGIGHAVAAEAARQGYAVCINYVRSKGPAEALAAKIREGNGKAIAVGADVSKRPDVERLFATCATRSRGPWRASVASPERNSATRQTLSWSRYVLAPARRCPA